MVVPGRIAAGSAGSAIATPERQHPAIKSATNLRINRSLPHFINQTQPPQLDWQSGAAVYDNRAERSRKGGKFECFAMERGVAPPESSNGASGRNIFARES